ncbi:MAG: hypothetical protein ACRCYX_11485 [Dermatophilaceae bacterium]
MTPARPSPGGSGPESLEETRVILADAEARQRLHTAGDQRHLLLGARG